MRELRSCDFCGADADGIYEVLPPELSPAEDEQRRVVLCGDCASTLETVLEPLLDRLGVESGSGGDAGRGQQGGVERGRDDPTDSLGSNSPMVAGRDAADELSAAASDADASPVEPETAGDADSGDATVDAETTGIADATDEEAGEPLQAAAAEDAGEREATETDAERTDESAEDESADSDAAPAGEEPPQFRKVMRLLNNREFPVERAEVEELAAGAYDLDDDHVRDIIDYAVERGVLADDGGTLRKA
ncbi:prolipoprotein diacylglyceryl transferase [Halopelagius longus]|uniref:Uncharacterized protein n=1 Tax=Halopelagius longus TaxID=1236180 RepID=A0A1H1ESZ8_9EURY|nr:hypothetical protein [Halopelagius longus]RDI71878.1 hypothetical protein DWB78_09160 [Halopelagius longus]SDQ91852.1 hypothetical protein SAMN05216278_3050 [Halopelagius longus]